MISYMIGPKCQECASCAKCDHVRTTVYGRPNRPNCLI